MCVELLAWEELLVMWEELLTWEEQLVMWEESTGRVTGAATVQVHVTLLLLPYEGPSSVGEHRNHNLHLNRMYITRETF